MRPVYLATTCAVVLSATYVALAQHHEHEAATKSALSTPEAMQIEHRHLHESLSQAMGSGGKTAAAAKQVEAELKPHFVEEEAYAMPPLSLLPALARQEQLTPEKIRTAIAMTDKLRANYDQMLKEHQAIGKSLEQLAAAAKEEEKPQAAAFVEVLSLHVKNEEQILYPAALLVGDRLKSKSSGGHD